MLYKSPSDWNTSQSKSIMLFGMSGLGKTYISELLRNNGDWFHYSVDYRIGWLICDTPDNFLFTTHDDEKWDLALKAIGIESGMLSTTGGTA